jgi:hypothetical protein
MAPTDRDREKARELRKLARDRMPTDAVEHAIATALDERGAEARREALLGSRITLLANALAGEFERTVARAEWEAAGSKGMHVPFHGDFASVTRVPSVISRMRWWLREFRAAFDEAGISEADIRAAAEGT